MPTLRSRKGNWLLALLILRHGSEVDRSHLAGTLWPDSTESVALGNLRRTLTDLRAALGSEEARIFSSSARTIGIDMSDAEADVIEFTAALERQARADLERAIALYRGALLEGCSEDWVISDREILQQSYLRSLEALARIELTEGNPTAAVRTIRRALAADPMRESTTATLMEALAAAGDFAAAVQAYRELRERILYELNSEPSAEITSLYRRIRANATQVATVRPLRTEPEKSPKLRLIPQPMSELIGRKRELVEIAALLDASRIVSLVGPGGIGKTRLATQIANDRIEQYDNGAVFVDLASVDDPSVLTQTVGATLSLREEPGATMSETVFDYLESRQMLIVLDNCEQIIHQVSEFVAALAGRCRQLRIVATSREPLGISGEVAFRVQPLSLPQPNDEAEGSLDLGALVERYEALKLFFDRARAVNPSFRVNALNFSAVTEICRTLDGIPLAIELAAARVRAMSVQEILSNLGDAFRLLTGGQRSSMPRQKTLRALIDWSYDLLDDSEQAILRRLSMVSGWFTIDDARALASGEAVQPLDVLDLLTHLIDKSLVVFESTPDGSRYRLLETVRLYCRERLSEAGELADTRKRLIEWGHKLVKEGSPDSPTGQTPTWYDRIEAHHDNLLAALLSARELGMNAEGLELATKLAPFWTVRGYLTVGRQWLKHFLGATEGQSRDQQHAQAYTAAGDLAFQQGDYTEARKLHETALSIWRDFGDEQGTAQALIQIGNIAKDQGDFETARKLNEEGLAIYRNTGQSLQVARTLNNLGIIAYHMRENESAKALYEESLALCREIGYERGIGFLLGNLGSVEYQIGRLAEAERLFSQSLKILRELGDKRRIGLLSCNLGIIAREKGDFEEARHLMGESLETLVAIGDKLGVADTMEALAGLSTALGRPDPAAVLFGAAQAIRKEIGAPIAPSEARNYDRDVEQTRGALGDDEFESLRREGSWLSYDVSVSRAFEVAAIHARV